MTHPDSSTDLTLCDREPIQFSGAVQPHGVLLAADPEGIIHHVSLNTSDWLGVPPEQCLGSSLTTVLGSAIEPLLAEVAAELDHIPLALAEPLLTPHGSFPLHVTVHRSNRSLVLELERASPPHLKENINSAVYSIARRLEEAEGVRYFCAQVVKEVRRLSGFDRVMVYRFESSGDGEVIAEDRCDHLEPYLGLHYPASDIPQQARRLYLENRLRAIPNAYYVPVPVIPACGPDDEQPLDLSFSLLRSVSPVHIEYMKNMGSHATLVLSLVVHGHLWGLIACHHTTPRDVSPSVRLGCQLLGQLVSYQLGARQFHEQLAAHQTQDFGVDQTADLLCTAADHAASSVQALLTSDGVAVFQHGCWTTSGAVPSLEMLTALAIWVKPRLEDSVYATNCLPSLFPFVADFADVACGLFALCVSRESEMLLFWFRPQRSYTVNWAGKPDKLTSQSTPSTPLAPRHSFALWQQIVHGQSVPWAQRDLRIAHALRDAVLLRQAEQAFRLTRQLEEVANRYRIITETVGEVFYNWDVATRTVDVSSGVLEIIGFAPDEPPGTSAWWFERIHSDDLDRVRRFFFGHEAREPVGEVQYRIRHKDGSYRTVLDRCRFLYGPDSQICRIIGYTVDVTQRIQTEISLALTQKRLAESQQIAQMGSWWWELPTGRIWWSENIYRIYGLDPDQVSPSSEELLKRVHPDDLPEYTKRLNEILAGRADATPYDVRIVRPDGRIVWVQSQARLTRDSAGHLSLLEGIDLNITARKQVEQALRESEARYRFLAETILPMVWVFSGSYPLDFCSQRWVEYTGQTHQAVLNGHWLDVIHPDDRALVNSTWDQAITSREPYQCEFRLRNKAGEYHWFLSQAHPMRDETSGKTRWFGTSTDIHDLRSSQNRLQETVHEREILLREVHHRVKNNLQIIKSLLRLQARAVEGTASRAVLLDSQARIASMALAHECLYVSNDFSKVQLHDYVHRLVNYFRCSFGDNDPIIELNVTQSDYALPLDRLVHYGLILNELVSNCRKHAFPDHCRGTIRINIHTDSQRTVRLMVADDGIGMKVPFSPSEPFSLGLQLVYGLAAQLRGEVSISSGPGTEVSVLFAEPGPAQGSAD